MKLMFYGSEFSWRKVEKKKIPLNYSLKYAPGVKSDGKFHGKYLRYSVNPTPDVFRLCRRFLVKLIFYDLEVSWRKVEKNKRFP